LALALALGIWLGAGTAGAVVFHLIVHAVLPILAIGVMYVAAVHVGRVPLARFAKAATRAYVVGMTTRSSMGRVSRRSSRVSRATKTRLMPPPSSRSIT
jgi:hypothetical protein